MFIFIFFRFASKSSIVKYITPIVKFYSYEGIFLFLWIHQSTSMENDSIPILVNTSIFLFLWIHQSSYSCEYINLLILVNTSIFLFFWIQQSSYSCEYINLLNLVNTSILLSLWIHQSSYSCEYINLLQWKMIQIHFREDWQVRNHGDLFLLQFLNNRTVDFKIVR